MSSFAVILPAAGSSTRFGSDKLATPLAGQSVIARSICAFEARIDVSHVIVAGRTGDARGKRQYVPGGSCRAETVRRALGAIPPEVQWVAVHDAARPLVSQALIDAVWQAAQQHGAAGPATPVRLTIKQAVGPLPAAVDGTIPRNELWAMQTPQIMRRQDLADGFKHCPVPLDEVTDDLQLLELINKPVWLVPGEDGNLKITVPLDLRLAEILIRDVTA